MNSGLVLIDLVQASFLLTHPGYNGYLNRKCQIKLQDIPHPPAPVNLRPHTGA